MSFISDFEAALIYMEDHLTSEIELAAMAQKAKCSSYHFQRLFSTVAGISLSEYIRRRKMTLAALELQNTGEKIIDLAIKYGYDSPSSFTRAFQSVQGITPSAARAYGAELRAYPPLTFEFIIKGAEQMQYRMIETKPYRLFGLNAVAVDGWDIDALLKYADRVIEDGSHDAVNIEAGFPGLAREMIAADRWDISQVHLLQLIHFWNEAGEKFCMYGWEVPEKGVGPRFTVLEIPKTIWVVVTLKLGEDRAEIAKCYQDLYISWFPTSGFEQAPGRPVLEKYNNHHAELWMPIVKKQSAL